MRRLVSSKPVGNFVLNEGSEQAKGLKLWLPKANGRDYSPFANHGVLTGFANPSTPTSGPAPGKDGGKDAIAYDGADDYVGLPAGGTSLVLPFAFVARVYPLTTARMVMYSKSTDTESTLPFASFEVNSFDGGANSFGYRIIHEPGRGSSSGYALGVITGEWNDLAIVRTGVGIGDFLLFLNGKPVAVTQSNNETVGASPTAIVRIGARPFTGSLLTFNGAMEDVRIADWAYPPDLIYDIGGPDPRKRWELRYVPGRIVYFLPSRSNWNWMFG